MTTTTVSRERARNIDLEIEQAEKMLHAMEAQNAYSLSPSELQAVFVELRSQRRKLMDLLAEKLDSK